MEDQAAELKSAEEVAKKAMNDAARLAEELRQEQDHAGHIEKMRRTLESQVRLQTYLMEFDYNVENKTLYIVCHMYCFKIHMLLFKYHDYVIICYLLNGNHSSFSPKYIYTHL